jgi:hypothetical protein
MTKNYTIWATLGDDLERIIEADFLDDIDLSIVESRIKEIYKSCDSFWDKLNAMDEKLREEYEEEGLIQFQFDHPYFIFNNEKHKNLMCYLTLAGVGFPLPDVDVPDVFNRNDAINLLDNYETFN